MNVLIAGGTGFVGSALTTKLIEQNNSVFIITRNPNRSSQSEQLTYFSYDVAADSLPKIDVVINLAGESLFGRWTDKKKERIINSRINSTKRIIDLVEKLEQKPHVFINASAVGFYGMNDDMVFTEKTTQPASDFLAIVTHRWEQTAKRAEQLGIRTIYARFGIILDKHAGALSLMKLPFQAFVGGKLGSGKQWMSWIHIEDCVNMLLFAMKNNDLRGPLNVTAPYPQHNKQFTKTLGKVLKRPTLFSVPESMARFALGEMSSLITGGQFVYPDKALQHHFVFKYRHLEPALNNLFKK